MALSYKIMLKIYIYNLLKGPQKIFGGSQFGHAWYKISLQDCAEDILENQPSPAFFQCPLCKGIQGTKVGQLPIYLPYIN